MGAENWYLKHKSRIMREVRLALRHYRKHFAESYGKETVEAVARETLQRFEVLPVVFQVQARAGSQAGRGRGAGCARGNGAIGGGYYLSTFERMARSIEEGGGPWAGC